MIHLTINDETITLPSAEGPNRCKVWPPELAEKLNREYEAKVRAELFPQARYTGGNHHGSGKGRGVVEKKEGIPYYAARGIRE